MRECYCIAREPGCVQSLKPTNEVKGAKFSASHCKGKRLFGWGVTFWGALTDPASFAPLPSLPSPLETAECHGTGPVGLSRNDSLAIEPQLGTVPAIFFLLREHD
jgi:hypothetical protein